jgi:hypothetical protein
MRAFRRFRDERGEGLPGVTILGGDDPPPTPRELLRALRYPDRSVVVDLSRQPHDEKMLYIRGAASSAECAATAHWTPASHPPRRGRADRRLAGREIPSEPGRATGRRIHTGCILRPTQAPAQTIGLLLLHLLSTADLRMGHVRWTRAALLVHQHCATLLTDVTITNGSGHADLHSRNLRDNPGAAGWVPRSAWSASSSSRLPTITDQNATGELRNG